MPYQKRTSKEKNFKIDNDTKIIANQARQNGQDITLDQLYSINRDIKTQKALNVWKDLAFSRDFANLKVLNPSKNGPQISFSRGTGATQIGSTGLVEFGPENLLPRSEELDLVWFGVGTSIIANSGTAPNGTQTAEFIREDSANSVHNINYSYANLPIGIVTVSVYAKPQGRNFLQFFVAGAATTTYVNFDLSNGTVLFSNVLSSKIIPLSNGWYRCVATFNIASVTGLWFSLASTGNQGRNTAYQGNGTSGIFLWGAQAERFSSERQYIQTFASVYYGPRFTHDPVTLKCLGLLIEESRVNIATYSEFLSWSGSPTSPVGWSVNTNAVWSSDLGVNGTQTAARLQGSSNNPLGSIGSNAGSNFVSGTTYTVSAWFKRNSSSSGDIRLAVDGTGSSAAVFSTSNMPIGSWVRLSASFAAASSSFASFRFHSNGVSLDVTIDKVQIEAGTFVTSYIPTVGSSATRAADVVQVTGINFSNLYNKNEGTVVADLTYLVSGVDTFSSQLYQDGNNYMAIRRNSGNTLQIAARATSTYDVTLLSGTALADRFVTAFSYLTGAGVAGSTNGGAVVTGSAYPNINASSLSVAGFGGGASNQIIARIYFYRRRFIGNTLQALTAIN